jgi:hypothetical protein
LKREVLVLALEFSAVEVLVNENGREGMGGSLATWSGAVNDAGAT